MASRVILDFLHLRMSGVANSFLPCLRSQTRARLRSQTRARLRGAVGLFLCIVPLFLRCGARYFNAAFSSLLMTDGRIVGMGFPWKGDSLLCGSLVGDACFLILVLLWRF